MKLGVEQRLAPIKGAIFTNPDSRKSFNEAMQVCFSFWGGMFWPILPFRKRFSLDFRRKYQTHLKPHEFYKGAIDNYDPDFILFDSSIKVEDLAFIIGERKAISIKDFIDCIGQEKIPFGITTTEVLRDIIEKEFKYVRIDSLNIVLPKSQTQNTYLTSLVGKMLPTVEKSANLLLQDRKISKTVNIKTAFEQDYWRNSINILDLNFHSIQTHGRRFWERQQTLFLIDTQSIEDLVNFWNLRALGWNIKPIPFDQLNTEEITNFLRHYCQAIAKDQSQMLSFIAGFTISKKSFSEFQSLLGSILSEGKTGKIPAFQPWFPRFWEDAEVGQYDKTNCPYLEVVNNHEVIEDDEKHFRFAAIKPPFDLDNYRGSEMKYKILINYSSYDLESSVPTTIFGIEAKDWISISHTTSFREHWRISKSGILFYCSSTDESISFSLPESVSFFKKYFSRKGFALEELPAGKLSKELIKNLRGEWGAQILMSKPAMEILLNFEDGNTIAFENLIGMIKKHKPNSFDKNPEKFIDHLLDRKVIELGVTIQCKICNQRSFYYPSVLSDRSVKCNICQNSFEIPQNDPKNDYKWSYRGLGPFSRNNKVSGLLCQISALRFFSEEFASSHFGSISSLMNFGLRQKKEFEQEIDLAVLLRDKSNFDEVPDLIFCECKTYKKFNEEDIERMKKIGMAFPRAILAFCTLNDELDKNEKRLISKLSKYFQKGYGSRPVNPILILTASELIPEELWRPYKAFGEIHTFAKHNDWLGNFCNMTVKHYLGIKTWSEISMEKWQKQNKRN